MKVLAVFAHPDDELGCIGTLAKHAQRGDEVLLVWTTVGELASQYGDKSHTEVIRTRQEHGAWVAGKIGCDYKFFDMGDSRMRGSRDEAIQLAKLYADFAPDVIITWNDFDAHPDHRATAKIAFDAITLARIPKIVSEGKPQQVQPHRKTVRFYQYYHASAPFPAVHMDVSEQLDLSAEVCEFYHDFYKWQWSVEDFRHGRRISGRNSGCKAAEKFTFRGEYAPAVDYLK